MQLRLLILVLLNLVSLQCVCQNYRVCEVSKQPAAVTYTNGEQVLVNHTFKGNKILDFQKFSKIAFVDEKSKEMYFFAGEGRFVVADLVKENKARIRGNFKAYMKEMAHNKTGFRQAGVVYKDEADSIAVWGAENLSLCDAKGKVIGKENIEAGKVYYFIVNNPTDSMAFVNVVARYEGGERELCCRSEDAAAQMDLIVPAGAQVLLADFPQVFLGRRVAELRLLAGRSPIDPQLALVEEQTLTVISPSDNSIVQYPDIILRYMVGDAGGVESVAISVNGKLRCQQRSIVPGVMESGIKLDTYGKNIVRITLNGKDGSTLEKELVLNLERVNKPKLHLLSVGIGDYRSGKLEKLHFASSDAAQVLETIDTLGNRNHHLYSEGGYRMLLTDGDATRGAILKCLDDIRYEADPEDIVMIYISGHGKFVEFSSKRYFLPYDVEDEPYLESTAISYAELKEKLKHLEDMDCKVVVYLDACYAGEMYFAKGANEFLADADPAVIGFYSSTRRQPSLEKKSLGHGVFTYALLNGLKGGAKDENENVTITSLGDYIAEQVRIESQGRQTPKVDNGGEDFILFRASNLPINVSKRALPSKTAQPAGDNSSKSEAVALAASYYSGAVVPPTTEKAFEAYTAAAAEGDPKSMYMLGVCYEAGKGCTADLEKALHWYKLSASEGVPAAQYNLGAMYYNGKAGTPDISLAEKWFAEAAAKDFPQAQAALGYLYYSMEHPDYQKAFKWLSKGAENGNAMALYYLGNCWLYGYGTPENLDEALKAYKKSASLGYGPAEEKLLEIY